MARLVLAYVLLLLTGTSLLFLTVSLLFATQL